MSSYRLARILVGMGIRKIRVTGGEPLLRDGIIDFLARLSRIEGIEDLAVTTNGYLLQKRLGRWPVPACGASTSAWIPPIRKNSRPLRELRVLLSAYLEGVDAALEAGLDPVKVNVVLVRGFNEGEILGFAKLAREKNLIVRFHRVHAAGRRPRLEPFAGGDRRRKSWAPSVPFSRWSSFRATKRARPPCGIALKTARARSASWLRFRYPFAASAAAFA